MKNSIWILVAFISFSFSTVSVSAQDWRFSLEAETRSSLFTGDVCGDSAQGEVRISPYVEYYSEGIRFISSLNLREGYPTEIYDHDFKIRRSDKGKPAGLLQEFYLWKEAENFDLKIGRFKPESKINFDFFQLNPFASLDSSEIFLSLEDDRLLGNWGGSASYDFGKFSLEVMSFLHEDPILATDEEDVWTRELPFDFKYGSFESEKNLDWGARLSGDGYSSQWELTFFNGSSQNVNHIEMNTGRKFDLIFPEQTTVQGALQVPISVFNLRLGASHNWRRWKGEDAGKFLMGIAELEYLQENFFREGDNLFLEIGYSNAWNTSQSDLFQKYIGMDQVYRGGSLLFSAEYSPREDWVLKLRGIWNTGNGSSYISPEISKYFYTDLGEIELSLSAQFIGGNSEDVISAYHKNDNVGISVKVYF